jgi:hypothetical protein
VGPANQAPPRTQFPNGPPVIRKFFIDMIGQFSDLTRKERAR